MNNTSIEIYRSKLENPDFEQDQWSRRTEGIYKIAHDSIRLMEWICCYGRTYYEIIYYYDLMGSICKHLNEISKRCTIC